MIVSPPMVKAVKESDTKRVLILGTGFVGRMGIPEIVKHPLFELGGVGGSHPQKVGRDVGEVCAPRFARCAQPNCWTTPTTRATTNSRWALESRPSTARC